MNFLNPEEQSRVKIHKAGDPGVVSKPASVKHVSASKAGAASGPGGTKAVAAVIKAKQEPKVQVVEIEPGLLEVHFTCSCGEKYVIRCNSEEKGANEEKSSEIPPTP